MIPYRENTQQKKNFISLNHGPRSTPFWILLKWNLNHTHMLIPKKIVRKARHSGTKPVFHACMFIIHYGQLTSIFQNFNQKLKINLVLKLTFLWLCSLWNFNHLFVTHRVFHPSCFTFPVNAPFSSLISLTTFSIFISERLESTTTTTTTTSIAARHTGISNGVVAK